MMAQLLDRKKNERLLAIDLFSKQEENVTKSGLGDFGIFARHAQGIFGPLWKGWVVPLEQNSLKLKSAQLKQDGWDGLRMVSIDGGHDFKSVMNDLNLMVPLMHEGGVVIVDDYHHPCWREVKMGTDMYCSLNTDWVPFYVSPLVNGNNKLMLCHKKHQKAYQAITPKGTYLNHYDGTPESLVMPHQIIPPGGVPAPG